MAGNFDKIVGPDGEWLDDEGGEESGSYVETREEFVVRCLNSAVNLYGIVTVEEFLGLYNIYAKNHDAPISDPLGAEEMERIAADAIKASEDEWAAGSLADETWFRLWTDPEKGERLVVYWSLADVDESELGKGETVDGWIRKEVDFCRGKWQTNELKVLSEKAFLSYDDANWGEESDDVDDLARVMSGMDDIDSEGNMGIIDANELVADLRINGPSIERALHQMHDYDCDMFDSKSYSKAVDVLKRVLPGIRSWLYRGRTQNELVEEGIWKSIPDMSAPSFRKWQSWSETSLHYGEEVDDDYEDDPYDYEKDAWDTGHLEDSREYIDSLPRPISSDAPFDFKKVKDAEWRARTIEEYEAVRRETAAFVSEVVIKEVTQKARKAAAKRLGFTDEDMSSPVGANLDMVVGDFASMMDDQNGKPAIKKVLAKRDKLVYWQKFAADYYEQYRYTWLEVQAVKSGCGLKCRDLLTGKDLFLMEKSFSLSPNAKGMTICAGIAPMGEVYIVLGVIHPVNFENPATILKIVLSHLGIPSELPIRLSFADQARFAAETIRRVHALGKFATIGYGV